ncbi:MAG TPA: HAD-IIA family hydrolase [Solirubrobacterales bacterium]|jgi:HAD superfamily hydrolase (TIGR01450 family)|nr:HAD-IIA family hydrolase [Solirubrobacterales bacterium]
MALADRFDRLLIDLDGVVWIGREFVPGATEALRELLAAGKEIVFVTNNPAKPPAAYAERLAAASVEIGAERIVTAGMVTARLAAEAAGPEGSAFVIGAPDFRQMVGEAIGAHKSRYAGTRRTDPALLDGEAGREANVVVVSGHREFDYAELLTATLALQRGAALLATSRDPTLPMPGGAWPGTGSILAAVETASGRRAEIGGKPERHLFEMALEAIGHKPGAAKRVAMVGDRLDSDIAGGRQAGLETVLVLSGASSREEAEAADPPPDHVADDLAALVR